MPSAQPEAAVKEVEILWLGNVIGNGVVKVDPSKVDAIVNMPEPSDKAALIHLLGMATYLDKFCRNLSGLTHPLRDFLKESSTWIWEAPQRAAWIKLKEAMSSLPAFRRFNLGLPAVLSVDASPTGLGAMQSISPVSWVTHRRISRQPNSAMAKWRRNCWPFSLVSYGSNNTCFACRLRWSLTTNHWGSVGQASSRVLPSDPENAPTTSMFLL